MTTSSEYITKRLGNEGYTFAEVQGYPQLDSDNNKTDVTFLIDPKKRAYVRRIEFRGNTKTADSVLRREMRQMEGGSANNALIDLSKVRLERVGFFNPIAQGKDVRLSIDHERVDYWVGTGATLSERVESLIRESKLTPEGLVKIQEKKEQLRLKKLAKKKENKEAEAPAEEAAEEEEK